MKDCKGISLVGCLVSIAVIVFLIFILLPALTSVKRPSSRLVCGSNVKGMSNALNVYAFDYRDEYPVQGAGTHTWGPNTSNWDDPDKEWANTDGTLTVASSLYLLVREADVGVKSFICKKSRTEVPFVNKTDFDTVELWDFGATPTRHQSYAYQFPYGLFPADAPSPPGNAIMADRNPWFDRTLTASSLDKESHNTFTYKVSTIDFQAESNIWKSQIGNSAPHDRIGQNVLFADGHVEFCKRSDVGTRYENIYTIGGNNEEEKRVGKAPAAMSFDAANQEDSLLVNDRD